MVHWFFSSAMPIAVVIRRLFLITLLVLPQIYWLGRAWRAAGWPRFVPTARLAVRLSIPLAVTAMAAVLYDRIAGKFLPEPVSQRIAPFVQLWIFSSSFAFFLTIALRVVAWCFQQIVGWFRRPSTQNAHDPTRRNVLYQAASIAGATPLIAALYGYSMERLRFEVEHVEVPVANLPQALDGLRIVHLSDIHVGDFMPVREVRRAVDIANELAAELTVITGDFVTSRGDPLATCIGELARLRAPLGVWGCNGNHEIYAGAEDDAELLFAENGMHILRQTAAQIQRKGSALNLIGIDYQRNVRITQKLVPTLNGAESLVQRNMTNILLSHNPNTFYRAAAVGVELSLAGHTHGGQVNVEILNTELNPARFVTSFVAGLYRLPMPATENGSTRQACLYVNRGLGTLGIPARIGANPEIALLTLRSA